MRKTYLSLAFIIGFTLALCSAAVLQRMELPVRWLASEAARVLAAPLSSPTASTYTVDWSSLDSGAGEITGGVYRLQNTIAQVDVGLLSGGVYRLEGGYWPGTTNPWNNYLPMINR